MVRDVPGTSNSSIGRCSLSSTKAEQRLKGGHRLPPAIVPKHELIQVDLKLRLTDPMVRTGQPLLQVPDRTVRKRHHRGNTFAQFGPARLRSGNVLNVCCRNAPETFQAVGVNRRSRCDILLDEIHHRRLLEVPDHGHPDPTRGPAPFFDSHQNNGGFSPFELTTPPQAGLRTAYPGVVDLHFTMQRLTRRVNHRASQLVQQHPRGFVSAQPKLPLEQERRDAPFVGDDQIGRPEPHRKWRSCVVENRAGRQRSLVSARSALPPSMFQHPISPPVPAAGTCEPIGPATRRQVVLTGLVAGELPLELGYILWKRRPRHTRTLHMVAC